MIMKTLLDVRTFILALILTTVGWGNVLAPVVVIPIGGDDGPIVPLPAIAPIFQLYRYAL